MKLFQLDEMENLEEKKKGSNRGGPPNGTMNLMQLGDMKGKRHQWSPRPLKVEP
jgi:hypothetical protein